MSELEKIKAAVNQMPRWQQEELQRHIALCLADPPRERLTAEEYRARLDALAGVGTSGMTTDEIMAMTRGEE